MAGIMLLFPISSFAQKTVEGCVKSEDGPVFAANIYLKNALDIHSASDMDGKFSLEIGSRHLDDTIVVSSIGYNSYTLPVRLARSPLVVRLKGQIVMLDAVEVKASSALSKEFSVMSLNKLSIYMYPSSDGDPLKAINLLPYSTNTSESANPELRGSSAGFSRVILNGVPIYNPVRNQQLNGMGNFSILNTEIIGEQNIYPGNPPLEYGNSIAGLVDIRTTAHLEDKRKINISASLANAGVMYSQRMGSNSFIQMYGNYQFSNLFKALNKKGLDYLRDFNSADFGMNFHHQFSNKVLFNVYSYLINESYDSRNQQYNYSGHSSVNKKRNFNIINIEYQADKTVLSLNNGTDFSTAKYSFGSIDDKHKESKVFTSFNLKHSFSDAFYFKSGIDYGYSRHSFAGKYPIRFYSLAPSAERVDRKEKISSHNIEAYLYATYNLDKFKFGMGIRKNIPVHGQKGYCSAQLNIRYNPNPVNTFIFSLGKYNGYSIPGYMLRKIEHLSSQQISLDYKLHLAKNLLAVSLYAKKEEYPSYIEEQGITHSITMHIKGIESSLAVPVGNFEFSASYTFLDTYFKTAGSGKTYKGSNGLNYLLKLSANYLNVRLFNASLDFIARPGLRYTPLDRVDMYNNICIPVFGEYNTARYRNYSTLDLSVNKYFQFRKSGLVAFLTLSNILDRFNEQYVYYNSTYAGKMTRPYQKRLCYFGCVFRF